MKRPSSGICLSTLMFASMATTLSSSTPITTRNLQFDVSSSSYPSVSTATISTTSQMSLHHTKLQTLYEGTIESPSITFNLENTQDTPCIMSGLGLNVQTSPTMMSGAGMIAGEEGPCRIKIYTRPDEGQEWRLGLDTSEVICMGPEVETLVSDEMIYNFYMENFGDEEHPFVIGAGESLEVYVVVLPVDGDSSGIQPMFLSSTGTSEAALYTSDSMLNLYEGSSVSSGFLVDAVANGGSETDTPSETKPTIFNGAIYYDQLPASLTVSDYFKNVQYSLIPGSATLGYLGCDVELGTGYFDSIGSYGVMFDLISLVPQDGDGDVAPMSNYAEVYGMDILTAANTSIEVYVRNNGGAEYISYFQQDGQTSIEENWELIAKGFVEGRGRDVGTPIPPEMWLRNVVLKPGDSVGFYVTVSGEPNLRYRKSELTEGDIFAQDGNLGIAVGRSWGQYPLTGDGSDTFFADREFSGSFKYHAHEGICQSSAPSVAATTLAPVASPEGLCEGSNQLKTTFHDGTGSYGALFDVVGKVAMVTLTGIDLNIDWNSETEADIIMYAKRGSWFGFQNDRDAWPLVLVNTTIYRPSTFPDRTGPYISIEHKMTSAMIPESEFTPLTIREGETWALYVLSSIPDLRYTMGTSVGQVCASNPELAILEGSGAADFPAFGSGLPEYGGIEYTFYAPRVFNGNLRYEYFTECPSEAPSTSLAPTPAPILKTSVTYMFYVEHGPEIPQSAVPGNMETGVRAVLDGLIIDVTNDLYELNMNDGFFISTVSAGFATPDQMGFMCVPKHPNLCTPISVQVEGNHLPSAPSDQVAYAMYRQASILSSLISDNNYRVVYVGKQAVETSNEITLSGVPGREMGDNEQAFFARAVQNFLHDRVAGNPLDEDGMKILSVTVDGQMIDAGSTVARAGGQRRLASSNKIKVKVQGQYRPPPEIDFGQIVEDSINADTEGLTRELKEAPESNYFEEVDVVGSQQIKEKIDTVIVLEDSINPMKGLLNMMAYGVGGMIVILSASFFLRSRRRAAIFGSKSEEGVSLKNGSYHDDFFDDRIQQP